MDELEYLTNELAQWTVTRDRVLDSITSVETQAMLLRTTLQVAGANEAAEYLTNNNIMHDTRMLFLDYCRQRLTYINERHAVLRAAQNIAKNNDRP